MPEIPEEIYEAGAAAFYAPDADGSVFEVVSAVYPLIAAHVLRTTANQINGFSPTFDKRVRILLESYAKDYDSEAGGDG